MRPFEIYNFNFLKYYYYLADNCNIIGREVILDFCLGWNYKLASFSLIVYFNLISKLIDPTQLFGYDQSISTIFPPNFLDGSSCGVLKRMVSKCVTAFKCYFMVESELGAISTAFLSNIYIIDGDDFKLFSDKCVSNFKDRELTNISNKNYCLDVLPLYFNKFNSFQRLELITLLVSNKNITDYDYEIVKQLLLSNLYDETKLDLNYDSLVILLSKYTCLPALYCICIVSSINPLSINSVLFTKFLNKLLSGASTEKYPTISNSCISIYFNLFQKSTFTQDLDSNFALQFITEYEILIYICNNCLLLSKNILIFMQFLNPILTSLGYAYL